VTNESYLKDETKMEEAIESAMDAVVRITYTETSGVTHTMNGLWYGCEQVIAPSHFIPVRCRDDLTFAMEIVTSGLTARTIKENVRRVDIKFPTDVVSSAPNVRKYLDRGCDLCSIRLRGVPAKVTKRSCFIKREAPVDSKCCSVRVSPPTGSTQPQPRVGLVKCGRIVKPVNQPIEYSPGKTTDILTLNVRDVHFSKGDCGSPLLVCDNGRWVIAGIYVAARGDVGSFQPVVRDLVDAFLTTPSASHGYAEKPDSVGRDRAFEGDDYREDTIFPGLSSYVLQGMMPESTLRDTALNKTALRPSCFVEEKSDLFDGKRLACAPAPATLAALNKAVRKKDVPDGHINNLVLDLAGSFVTTALRAKIGQCSAVGVKAAMTGVCSRFVKGSLNMDTSPGLPWTSGRPSVHAMHNPELKGKRYLFNLQPVEGDERMYWQPKPALAEAILRRTAAWKCGESIPAVFAETLKDEKRDLERVAANKARLFSAAPVDKVIADRMLFLDFKSQYEAGFLDVNHAIGINPESSDWTDLAERHLIHPNHAALDYSGWDGSIPLAFTRKGYEIIGSFYDPVEAIWVAAAGEEVCTNYAYLHGNLYQTSKGNPSGHVMTTVLNSIVNHVNVMYTYIIHMLQQGLRPSFAHAQKNLVLHTFGDDLIYSVSEELASFTPDAFAAISSRTGMKATGADKESAEAFVDWSEITFLKRNFVLDAQGEIGPGVWKAPLERGVIYEIPRWTHKGCNDMACTVTSFLSLLSSHSFAEVEEAYDELCDLDDPLCRQAMLGIDHTLIYDKVIHSYRR
jgi:hypothetical protein